MNLVDGEVKDGVFAGVSGLRVPGLGQAKIAKAVLGVRPEDAEVVGSDDPRANFKAPIYSVELTGENTLVSVHVGAGLLTMRADKNFDGVIDQQIGVHVAAERAFLFDRESQNRVDF
jgi:multiple sugar transport system ATP-binding protein